MSGTQLQEYVGEYRHRETADSDSVPACEKEERYPDEDGVERKKGNESVPSYKSLHLVSENIEKKTVREQVEGSAMEKLIEEKLYPDLKIESLCEKELIHPIIKDIGHEKGHRRHDKGEEYEEIGKAVIAHRGAWSFLLGRKTGNKNRVWFRRQSSE